MSISLNGSSNTITPVSAVQPTGSILQVVQTVKTDTSNSTINANTDTSVLISTSITPSSSSSKILISAYFMVGCSSDNGVYAKLNKDGSVITDATGDAASNRQRVSTMSDIRSSDNFGCMSHQYLDTAGGTNAITYGYKFSHASSSSKTIYINKTHGDSDSNYQARGTSVITLTEIAA